MQKIEIVELQDIDYETAKKEILGYYQKHRDAYPDEAANALGIELELAVKIVKELVMFTKLSQI